MLRQTNQQPITALYPRLSHEDELQGESNSISNHYYIYVYSAHQTMVPLMEDHLINPASVCPAKRKTNCLSEWFSARMVL